MTLWIIYLTSTHPKLSKNISVYCIIPSSLFTTIFFKRAKTVRLQEPSAPFCGILNELRETTTHLAQLGGAFSDVVMGLLNVVLNSVHGLSLLLSTQLRTMQISTCT